MFRIGRPQTNDLNQTLKEQLVLQVSYDDPGFTQNAPSAKPGYFHHEAISSLGKGEALFLRARKGIKTWKHFAVDGIFVYPTIPDIESGTTLIVAANHMPMLWSTNPCRVLYVIDEESESEKTFGYGYGTLPGHSERGEERFLVRWNAGSNEVTYEILAFSKPNGPVVTLGWPVAIVIQNQFRYSSLRALKRNL